MSQDTDRRGFLGTAGAALAAASAATAAPLSEKDKLSRIASNTWPLRNMFKRRPSSRANPTAAEMKKKYGEITMLDMPQFTKDTYPGVYHMDLWSSLFGDVTDDSMFTATEYTRGGRTRTFYEFDPATASGKKWLDKLAGIQVKAGVRCHHVSNNAPRNISDLDAEKRKEGIAVARKWLDAAATLGAKTMRVNTGGPRVAPSASADRGYPRNDEIVTYLNHAIESFKAMADYGGKVGVKVTIENHWGLSADPMNIRIILDEVNHPFCEATPDFCNWEHEYMLYHGIQALAPYTHSTVHAKYWDRWKNPDVQRNVRILTAAKYKGIFALEYEDGPWDGVEGSKYLLREVLAAL
ncbi:MAG: TIM barrel protein [bacterium]|nr:TIM barrel protein [bacterium]